MIILGNYRKMSYKDNCNPYEKSRKAKNNSAAPCDFLTRQKTNPVESQKKQLLDHNKNVLKYLYSRADSILLSDKHINIKIYCKLNDKHLGLFEILEVVKK